MAAFRERLIAVFAIAVTLTLSLTQPASATPIFVAIFTALGASASVASFLGGLVTSLITTGLSLLLAPKPPKPEDGKEFVQSSIPHRIFGYGETRVAGAAMYMEEYKGKYILVLALCAHRIDNFVSFYLNDDPIPLAASAPVTDPVGDGRYASRINLYRRVGLNPSSHYAEVLAAAAPGTYSTSFRGDGQASMAMICDGVKSKKFSKVYPNGKPKPSAVLRLKRCYDPRNPAHVRTNEATWTWTDNPVLHMIDWLCHNEFGRGLSYARAILPVQAEWIAEANLCDVLVNRKGGGTEKRYRSNGWASTENDFRTVTKAILDTCDGWMVERGDGTIIMRVGVYRAPTVTLTEDDIAGYFLPKGIPADEVVNQLSIAYTSPDHDYTTQEIGPIDDTVDQAARGKIKANRIELTWTHYNTQASRLGNIEMNRGKSKIRGEIDVRLSGINAMYERWVAIDAPSIRRLHNQVIENRMSRISILAGGFKMQFLGSGADIYAYDPNTQELDAPAVPPPSTVEQIPALANEVVTVQRIEATNGPTVYIDITFDEPDRDDLDYRVRWKLSAATSTGAWTELSFNDVEDTGAGQVILSTPTLPPDTLIDLEVYAIGGKDETPGPVSVFNNVSTAIATAAPAPPQTLSATGGVGQTFLTAKAPNTQTVHHLVFYRVGTGLGFGLAVQVGPDIPAGQNQTITYTNTGVPPGVYDYYVSAETIGGTSSTPTGPATVTVT